MWTNSDIKYLLLFIGWFPFLVDVVAPVRIKELRVPAVARHGAAVVLDCDYTLDGDVGGDEGLVVKWYLNDQSRPVYVWIPGVVGGPRGLGVLNGRLNLTYRASQDKRTEHRALHIPASTRDVAGEYTCVVSTFHDEDRQTKTMLVFVPEKSLRLQRRYGGDGIMDAVCSAEGVYPQPEMIIRITYDNISYALDGGTILHRQRDGLYDVSLNAPLPREEVDHSQQSPVAVTCELSIPVANYTVHKEMLYYPGKASRRERDAWVILAAYGIVKYILNF